MPLYRFKGRTFEKGIPVAGEEHADSKQALAERLRNKGVFPVAILEAERSVSVAWGGGPRGPGGKGLALFADQFSVMLHAGLPLVQCLQVLSQQQGKAGFRVILSQIRAEVEGGSTLADALRKYPNTFDQLFTNMIEAGEVGGFLDRALERLSTYLRKAVKLKQQVLAASLYPLIVTVVAAITVSLTLVWVVPVFVSLFRGLDVPLPLPTRFVIAVSDWTGRYSIPLGCLVVLSGVGLRFLRRSVAGQLLMDRAFLSIPLLGNALAKVAIARFALTLATLLRSGVPLLRGLEITTATSDNSVFRSALTQIRKDVSVGKTVSEPMAELEVFPPLVTHMVATGEQAGELDRMLEHLATLYEEESEAAISQLMTALEPTLVVVLGILVGGIVISMYLPIFSLFGHIAK